MKTTPLLKKALTTCVVFLMFISATSFKTAHMQKLDYYFFLTADPNPNGTGGDKNRYVSQFIYYAGYESCGKDYDFEKKAREAFEKYIMAEYPSVKNLRIIVESKKNGSYKIKTKQEAQTKLNSWIADEERTNDHKVVKTMFSFSCE